MIKLISMTRSASILSSSVVPSKYIKSWMLQTSVITKPQILSGIKSNVANDDPQPLQMSAFPEGVNCQYSFGAKSFTSLSGLLTTATITTPTQNVACQQIYRF